MPSMPDAYSAIVQSVDALDVITAIVTDPYFPQVVGIARELSATETSEGRTGIGLSGAVVPLQIFLASRKLPWLIPVVVASAIGLPFLFGFGIGKHVARRNR